MKFVRDWRFWMVVAIINAIGLLGNTVVFTPECPECPVDKIFERYLYVEQGRLKCVMIKWKNAEMTEAFCSTDPFTAFKYYEDLVDIEEKIITQVKVREKLEACEKEKEPEPEPEAKTAEMEL